MNTTKKHNRKDSRHKLKNKRRVKQSNKKRITKRVTKKNRKIFRGGEKMDAEFIKGAFETIATGGKDGVEGPVELKAVEFKKDNPTICNVYRFTEKTSGKMVYILTDFENLKTALFYEIIFNFCFALAIPLDIAWVITAFIILIVGLNSKLIHIIVFITELAINSVIFLVTRRMNDMPLTTALVEQENFKVPSITNLLTNFKEYNKNDRDVRTIKALICKLKNYFSVNSSMEIKKEDFNNITFKSEEEQNNFFDGLYTNRSLKAVLFLKEKDDGSGFGIGYVHLKFHIKHFVFTGIDMSSLNLEILNNFFTNDGEFHENLTARFKKLTDDKTNNAEIDESKLKQAIGSDSDLLEQINKSDEEKAAFAKKLMDSGAFDNVKLDLFAPRRLGETDSDRQAPRQQVTGTDFALFEIQQKRDKAMKSLGNSTGPLPPPPTSV